MKCEICEKREATVFCRKCGTSFCMKCHSKYGDVGMFKGTCAKCGANEVVRKG